MSHASHWKDEADRLSERLQEVKNAHSRVLAERDAGRAYAVALTQAATTFLSHCTACLMPHEEQAMDALKAVLAKAPQGCHEIGILPDSDEARHARVRENMLAAEAWPAGTTRDEKRLRGLLARRVGLTYGDDGELQSGEPFPPIDFKRDSVEDIERKLTERGMAKLEADLRADPVHAVGLIKTFDEWWDRVGRPMASEGKYLGALARAAFDFGYELRAAGTTSLSQVPKQEPDHG